LYHGRLARAMHADTGETPVIRMSYLILIKHATPVKDPDRPSHQWELSEDGRTQAIRLAKQLQDAAVAIDLVCTSDEPKAKETGQIIAAEFDRPMRVVNELAEHDRSNVPVMPTREFISSVALFFKEADRLVLGRETAQHAQARITHAIEQIMSESVGKHVAIVSHGTVISLFAAEILNEDPFQLWRRMGLPSYILIDWERRAATRVVERV
jgi:broad specificity phosphatase PhoE